MTAEPRHNDFIPPPDEAVALPTPELATRLLAYLVALEDASGGYRQPQVVSQLHPNNIHLAGSWPDHAVKPHREAFLFAIGEAWAWLLLRPGARRVRQRRQHPAGAPHHHRQRPPARPAGRVGLGLPAPPRGRGRAARTPAGPGPAGGGAPGPRSCGCAGASGAWPPPGRPERGRHRDAQALAGFLWAELAA